MIAFLNGILRGKMAESAVIECAGVGYSVGMSAFSLAKLPEVGQTVQIYTYLQVREDAMTLFGFSDLEEKALFEKLISVSGVGPKVALAALSSFEPQALSNAIISQDAKTVARIPGVGKKTAQRIILELQGSLDMTDAVPKTGLFMGNPIVATVVEDLLAMGFTSTEADLACKDMPEGFNEQKGLQYALKRLGEHK